MKLYTEEQVNTMLSRARLHNQDDTEMFTNEYLLSQETPIELPSDEDIIGRFMNWFLKHYSTATIDGMFGYVNSMEEEVTIREILDEYFNKEQILNQNK